MRNIMRTTSLRAILVAFVLASSTVAVSAPAATAEPPNTVSQISDRLAQALSAELTDNTVRENLAALAPITPVDLTALDVRGRLAAMITKANADLLAAKGLPAGSARLARARLGHESMVAPLRRGVTPLVAATPTDDKATDFTAYSPAGKAQTLSAATIPQQPVLFVEVDVHTATQLGMAVVEQETAKHQKPEPKPAATTAGGYWASQISSIRFEDVQEPWFKGAAEIFAIVGGFDHNGDVRADTLTLPYLDDPQHTYYPNQLLVHWNRYKYNVADVVFMEDDGDTNYLQLAQALVAALAYILDAGAYQPLVSAILNALPSSWWTDDPDFVDACYALTQDANWTRSCAGGNGTLGIRPFWVSEL
jgi:hypothetical protein